MHNLISSAIRFVFFSFLYWINFIYLYFDKSFSLNIGIVFYIFILFFVFPVGHCIFNMLSRRAILINEYFIVLIEILLGVAVLGAWNFLFGISYLSNMILVLCSYIYVLFEIKKYKGSSQFLLKDNKQSLLLRLKEFISWPQLLSLIFVLGISFLLIFLSRNSLEAIQITGHSVKFSPYPSDGSRYLGWLNSLLRHEGSLLGGFNEGIAAGGIYNALRFLNEIFEAAFLKLFKVQNIIFFQFAFYPFFLILLLVSALFLPIARSGSTRGHNVFFNLAIGGLILLYIWSYLKTDAMSLFVLTFLGPHQAMGYILMIFSLKLFTAIVSADKTVRKPLYKLLIFMMAVSFVFHAVSGIIFFVAFMLFFINYSLSHRVKIIFNLLLIGAIIFFVIFLALSGKVLTIGDVEFSINSVHKNIFLIDGYYYDKYIMERYSLDTIFPYFLGATNSNLIKSLLETLYILIYAGGLWWIFIIYYFLCQKSKLKYYFIWCLAGMFLEILLLNYARHRPELFVNYFIKVLFITIAAMVFDLWYVYSKELMEKISFKFKVIFVLLLLAPIIIFNVRLLERPWETMTMSRTLYDLIVYVREETPSDAVILHRIHPTQLPEIENPYAYFSGYAGRTVIIERPSFWFAYPHKYDTLNRFYDIIYFYDTFEFNNKKQDFLKKYGVDYVIIDKSAPVVELPNDSFIAVYDNRDYQIYKYKNNF